MKTWVEISKNNLFHNINEIAKHLKPDVNFMAVLKSNAYGHGIKEVAEALLLSLKLKSQKSKLRMWIGVDSIEESLLLQKIPGAEKIPTLILGYVPLSALKLVPQNVRLTIYNLETIKALSKINPAPFRGISSPAERCGINKNFKVHFKIETGTRRQGIDIKELPKIIKAIKQSRNIEVEGISSHFAEAENLSSKSLSRTTKRLVNLEPSASTKQQLENFYNAVRVAEKLLNKKLIKHIACSAAASHFKKSQCDLVRVGINLYGLQSINYRGFASIVEAKPLQLLNLKPVMSWKTMVAQVKNVKKGTPIGYGRTEKMPYDGQITVLPIGYWDGYDRRLSGIGEVIICGKLCKIIGRVCMNMCMALLPRGLQVKVEDEVTLIGKQDIEEITADELAKKTGTINYEVVTRINPLIPRIINN